MNNRIQSDEPTTVCCVCGRHINGPWPASHDISHGYCNQHFQIAMQKIQAYFALQERQQIQLPRAIAA